MKKNIFNKIENKPLTIFLVIVLIIGLCCVSYFVYEIALKQYLKNSENIKQYTLNIYQNEYGICGDQNNICNELSFSIETYTSNSKYIAIDNNDSFILYDDNGLYLYNIKKKESNKINLDNNYLNYELYLNNKKDSVVGIIYSKDDYKEGYYNIQKNIKLYEGVYDNIEFLDENYIEAYNGDLNQSYLLGTNNNKEELTFKQDENICNFNYQLYNYNGKYYFLEIDECDIPLIKKIYDNNKNILFEGVKEKHKISFVGGFLYLISDNHIQKYDTSGNILASNKDFTNVLSLINNYVVNVKDNTLNLFNFDTKEEIKIGEWNDNYIFNYYESNYLTREYLDSIGELEKEEGFYITIDFKEIDLEGNTGINYYYNLKENKVIENYVKE